MPKTITNKINIGQKFGRGKIIKQIEKRINGCISWELLCDCGNIYFCTSSKLLNKDTKSCGCLKKEKYSLLGNNNTYLPKLITCEKLLKEWDYSKNTITPNILSLGSNKKVWWICSRCCHNWQATTNARYNENKGCKFCNCSSSKGEKNISNFLLVYNIKFEREKRFKDCKNIKELRFDFYLPYYNIYIEFQGQQHYYRGRYKDADNRLEQIKIRDQIKRDYCKNNKIDLLEISYLDYKNIEKILKEKLSITL